MLKVVCVLIVQILIARLVLLTRLVMYVMMVTSRTTIMAEYAQPAAVITLLVVLPTA